MLLVVLICMGLPVIVKATETSRSENIKSKGIINYDNQVIIDASDFVYLADEIDDLENTYKEKTIEALNEVGTYFQSDGSITWDASEGEISGSDSSILSFGDLQEGILNSQSVESVKLIQASNASGLLFFSDSTAQENRSLSKVTTNNTGYPVYQEAALCDNLSAGSAAWVNGHLIVGNGADNQAFYAIGYMDGINQALDNVTITYTYHNHTGENGTGCYTTAIKHSHTSACNRTIACTCSSYKGDTSNPDDIVCGRCGHHVARHGGGGKCSKTETTIGCGIGEGTVTGYNLGCGKTETTIETAYIVFN